jgi:CysZ protein
VVCHVSALPCRAPLRLVGRTHPRLSRDAASSGHSATRASVCIAGLAAIDLVHAHRARHPAVGPPRGFAGGRFPFLDGFLAIFRGGLFVWRTRAAWPLAAVPVVVCSLLCVLSIVGAFRFVPQLLAAAWPNLDGFAADLLELVASTLTAIVGVLLATFITPALSAPALERLVLLRERALGVAPRAPAGFWRELRCALQAQLVAVAVFGPMLLLLLLITWVFPPSAVVTVPTKLVVLACLLAWSLLDYPLSLRGVSLSDRVRLMRQGAGRVLGFGLGLALIYLLPFLSFLLLPAAVAAAAEIALHLEQPLRA